MIKSIHLQNWKSFRDATLYFDPLTILIGTNASGKSNALDAIDFLARMGQGKDLATCLRSESNGDSFRGGVDWVATKGEDSFTITMVVAGAEENEEYEYSLQVSPAPKPLITSEKLIRHKRRPRSKTNFKPLQIFWTDPCQADAAAIAARLYNEKGGSLRPMQRGIPILSQLQIGVANIARQEILIALKTVSSALGHLFLLNPIPSHMRDYCQKADRLNHDGSNLAGVIAALPAERKKEIGTQRSVDIVATTHNPARLDALGPEMVPFVIVAHRDPESGDSKLTLLEDVANLTKLMAQGRLASVATSGALERSLNPTTTSSDHGHR